MYSKVYDVKPIRLGLKEAGVDEAIVNTITLSDNVATLTDKLSGLTTKAHKEAAAKAIEHAKGAKARQQARSDARLGY